jgi:hypothetical protein
MAVENERAAEAGEQQLDLVLNGSVIGKIGIPKPALELGLPRR